MPKIYFQHMPLTRLAEPFSHPDWIFEPKWDGWRGLAYVRHGQCELVSRKGYVYKRFTELAEEIARAVKVKDAVLDGEIVCLDRNGKSQFYSLMFRRGPARFYAFDLLQLNGKDLRSESLVERKRLLKSLITGRPSSALLYVDHLEERGEELFQLACREDLEGIVAKWKFGRYDAGRVSSLVKIKNAAYTQIVGREKLFEKKQNQHEAKEQAADTSPHLDVPALR